MDIQKNMATVMRALKEKSGKSMAEFSEELEISRSALQEYLSGSGNPNVQTIEHLAEKMKVDASFLVSGAFADKQAEVLLKLLDVLGFISELSPPKRKRFARLLLKMVVLWEGNGHNE